MNTAATINGKNIHLSQASAGYFVYDFLSGTDAEQYGALCAIGLQDEARELREARSDCEALRERRSRDQIHQGDDFLSSIVFEPHTLDAAIAAAEDRVARASRVVGDIIDAAIRVSK